ncbi:MAG TPA: Sir2 family NAD-dependent protein deacetylase [Candidatus Absconditabacterales bacterium]|nr:Sir2 family NAD-dependent protein deacetylase [Candidatus Absconditabacterales bacterium]HPK27696.1 Sir2 family NAD-dependent protein deacetylase [Candidatus Absconditabacterales bacterium]
MLNTIQKREEVNQISGVEASQEKAIQKTKNIEKLLEYLEEIKNKIEQLTKKLNTKKTQRSIDLGSDIFHKDEKINMSDKPKELIQNQKDNKNEEIKDKKIIEKLKFKGEGVDLFSAPKLISNEQLKVMREDLEHSSFSFSFKGKEYFLGYLDGKPFIRVTINGELPPDLSENQKLKFKKINNEGKIQYVQDFGIVPGKNIESYTVSEGRRDFSANAVSDFFMKATDSAFSNLLDTFNVDGERKKSEEVKGRKKEQKEGGFFKKLFSRNKKNDEKVENKDGDRKKMAIQYFKNKQFDGLKEVFSEEEKRKISSHLEKTNLPQVKKRSTPELAENIKNKKILFYTGAGMSIASNIPDMKTLEKDLGINGNTLKDGFLNKFINNPENAFEARSQFTHNSRYGEPTKAHFAIKELSEKLSCQIFTENVDFLQKNTGIQDHHVSGQWLKENISEDQMKNIDFIITAGLSADDRGMLRWYKDINSNGKIIALNLEQPNYLGKEDILVKGDIQKTLPELNALVQN